MKRQYLRISIFLRSLLSAPSQLVICFPLYTTFSCLTKIMATTVGTYIYPPLRIVVLFSLFLDYLGLASFLWWLDGHTTVNSRARSQLRSALYCTVGVAVVLLLIAVLGAIYFCWLLALEVSSGSLYRYRHLQHILTLTASNLDRHHLDDSIILRRTKRWSLSRWAINFCNTRGPRQIHNTQDQRLYWWVITKLLSSRT